MSDVAIRPTIPSDLDALAGVLVEVHAVDGYPVEGVEDPLAWLSLPLALGQWTALVDGQAVGHVAVARPGPDDAAPFILMEKTGRTANQVGVLVRLFVDPSARGRSLAHRLMDAAEGAARAAGLVLSLDVMSKDHGARHLYRVRGWEELGEFEHLNGEVAVQAVALRGPSIDLD